MRQLARQGRQNPEIRTLAQSLTNHLPGKNWIAEIKVLHKFVRDQIRYLRDINGVETIQTPEQLLRTRSGDCDDQATLLASLLESIGHPARFRAVGFKPGRLEHVYVETQVGRGGRKKWLPLETTENVEIGWRPPRIVETMVRHV